jgi:hypothetical protein
VEAVAKCSGDVGDEEVIIEEEEEEKLKSGARRN